jgi:transcriptional regulator with XRE-family HTH domain
MGRKFGSLLRERRKQVNKTMGDLAEFLRVSVPYISDVERGNRKPFSDQRIRDVARFLGTDAEDLIIASAEDDGGFRLEVLDQHPKSLEVGAALMRGWPELSDVQLEEIQQILRRMR